MRKHIVIINGSGGVGKDTFVDFCRDHIEAISISSVDKIKEAAMILGWNGGKTEEDRRFLSDIKLLNMAYNDGPYKYISESIIQFRGEEGIRVVFIHLREPEEIDKIKKEFDCTTLFIKNTNVSSITSNMADANVDNYKYDYVIDNSGTLDDLKQKAKIFVAELVD